MITYGKYPGRFGNQLFCIAGTVGIARRNEMDFGFEAQTSFQSIFEKTLPAASKTTIQEYTQEHFHYYPITLLEPTRLIGYFQSEKFFSNAADEVRELFKIRVFLVATPNIAGDPNFLRLTRCRGVTSRQK